MILSVGVRRRHVVAAAKQSPLPQGRNLYRNETGFGAANRAPRAARAQTSQLLPGCRCHSGQVLPTLRDLGIGPGPCLEAEYMKIRDERVVRPALRLCASAAVACIVACSSSESQDMAQSSSSGGSSGATPGTSSTGSSSGGSSSTGSSSGASSGGSSSTGSSSGSSSGGVDAGGNDAAPNDASVSDAAPDAPLPSTLSGTWKLSNVVRQGVACQDLTIDIVQDTAAKTLKIGSHKFRCGVGAVTTYTSSEINYTYDAAFVLTRVGIGVAGTFAPPNVTIDYMFAGFSFKFRIDGTGFSETAGGNGEFSASIAR